MADVNNVLTLRPALFRFAQEMERTLRKHDAAKGEQGWRTDCDVPRLLELLARAQCKLNMTVGRGDFTKAEDKAIDVANLAMMVSDYLKARA